MTSETWSQPPEPDVSTPPGLREDVQQLHREMHDLRTTLDTRMNRLSDYVHNNTLTQRDLIAAVHDLASVMRDPSTPEPPPPPPPLPEEPTVDALPSRPSLPGLAMRWRIERDGSIDVPRPHRIACDGGTAMGAVHWYPCTQIVERYGCSTGAITALAGAAGASRAHPLPGPPQRLGPRTSGSKR